MQVTFIGWIFLIVSAYGFFWNKKILFDLLTVSSIFTAASIVNIKATTTGILPFYIIGLVWIIRSLLDIYKEGIKTREIIKKIRKNKLIISILIFIFIIILSELNLILFGKSFVIENLIKSESINVGFGKSNISQPIYTIFMLIIIIFMILELDNKEKLKRVVKVFSYTTVFAIIWGLAQFCMKYLNIEYPSWIFNNNIAYSQQYNQMVYGIKRINSVALEPSMFSLNLVIFLSIVMILWISKYKGICDTISSRIIIFITLILTLLCTILTTSTTAYVCLVVIILITTIYSIVSPKGSCLNKNKYRVFMLYLFGIIILLISIIYIAKVFHIYWGTFVDTFLDMTIRKIGLESGNHRISAFKTAINIFKDSPILGFGYGSFRSFDLFSNLLANMGIVGLVSFSSIIYITITRIIKYFKINQVESFIMLLAVTTATIALMISIPDLNFAYYWIMIAVCYLWNNEQMEMSK